MLHAIATGVFRKRETLKCRLSDLFNVAWTQDGVGFEAVGNAIKCYLSFGILLTASDKCLDVYLSIGRSIYLEEKGLGATEVKFDRDS